MTGFEVDLSGLPRFDAIVAEVRDACLAAMGRGVAAGGTRLKAAAQQLTRDENAVASRQYLEGFRVDVSRPDANAHAATMTNIAPHAYYVEEGRAPGRMPPQDAIEAWMAAKGIPAELSFVIRRSIAELGTIRRAGARGQRAGLHISERALSQSEEALLDLIAAEIGAIGS